jgi:hypothetical protein
MWVGPPCPRQPNSTRAVLPGARLRPHSAGFSVYVTIRCIHKTRPLQVGHLQLFALNPPLPRPNNRTHALAAEICCVAIASPTQLQSLAEHVASVETLAVMLNHGTVAGPIPGSKRQTPGRATQLPLDMRMAAEDRSQARPLDVVVDSMAMNDADAPCAGSGWDVPHMRRTRGCTCERES